MKITVPVINVIECLSFVILLTVCHSACAKSKKMPSGEMYAYSFIRGGGMNRLDQTVYQLSYDEDTGKLMLYVSGDCQGELISMEVGTEVMEKCYELVKQHKLYKSKGFYESSVLLLDAPSSSFYVSFRNPCEFISGSGNMPDDIFKGINAVNQYLRSVVGDRKAEGHVDRVYNHDGIKGMHWTDGRMTVITPNDSEEPLKKAARQLDDSSSTDISQMGYSRFKDGDRHYFVIHDYKNNMHRVFVSFDGSEKSLQEIQMRDAADMLFGTFTDNKGHRFVFSPDGKVSKDGAEPTELMIFGQNSRNPMIILDGHQMRSFKLTEKGVDFFGLQLPGDRADNSVPACSLIRVGDETNLWPVVNERFLTQPMLDRLSDDQLEQMLKSIHMHNTMPEGDFMWFSDIGEVNHEVLMAEKKHREK